MLISVTAVTQPLGYPHTQYKDMLSVEFACSPACARKVVRMAGQRPKPCLPEILPQLRDMPLLLSVGHRSLRGHRTGHSASRRERGERRKWRRGFKEVLKSSPEWQGIMGMLPEQSVVQLELI